MKKRLYVILGTLSVIVGTAIALGVPQQISLASTPRDCDNNSAIYCGAVTNSELQRKYKENKTGDLDNIYSHYGIKVTDYGKAKMGRVYKDGRVTIGNEVVATNAKTMGRYNIAGSKKVTIDGKTYYEHPPSVTFGVEYITAFVMLDQYGKFVNAILTSCGNPVVATPKPKPYYACTALHITALSGNRFQLDVDATVRDATYKYTTYTVRGSAGHSQTVRQDRGQPNPIYTQNNPDKYTVEAVVTVDVFGKLVNAPVGVCKGSFTVTPPPVKPEYACDKLTLSLIKRTDALDQIKATVTQHAKNATYLGTNYVVKNGAGATVLNTEGTNELTYTPTKADSYTFTASTRYRVGTETKTVTSPACTAKVTVSPLPPEPVYTCDTMNIISKDRTTREFSVVATGKNGATPTDVTVTYDDGKSDTKAYGQKFSHSYAPGTYKAKATVTFTVNGKSVAGVTSPNCEQPITINQPPVENSYICDSLDKIKKDDKTYEFNVTAAYKGNVTPTNVTVNYGDQTSDTKTYGQKFTHTYTPGTWNVVASIDFTVDGKLVKNVTSDSCKTKVTVEQPPVEECKPGIPVGDERCTDYCKPGIPVGDSRCEEQPPVEECKPGIPMGSDECKVVLPAELPKTGPTDLALSGLIGSGALGLGVHSWMSSRRAVRSALRK